MPETEKQEVKKAAPPAPPLTAAQQKLKGPLEPPKFPPLTSGQMRAKDPKPAENKPVVKAEPKEEYKGPWFHITPAVKAVRSELSAAQRSHSHFIEAPRIGATILRRGTALKLTQEQFKRMETRLHTLHMAHAIDIHVDQGDGEKQAIPRGLHVHPSLFLQPLKTKEVVEETKEESKDSKEPAGKPIGKVKLEKKGKKGSDKSEDEDTDPAASVPTDSGKTPVPTPTDAPPATPPAPPAADAPTAHEAGKE
jgi:hypothetical protein